MVSRLRSCIILEVVSSVIWSEIVLRVTKILGTSVALRVVVALHILTQVLLSTLVIETSSILMVHLNRCRDRCSFGTLSHALFFFMTDNSLHFSIKEGFFFNKVSTFILLLFLNLSNDSEFLTSEENNSKFEACRDNSEKEHAYVKHNEAPSV